MRITKTLGVVVVLATAISLSACGRKGPLEAPPGKSSAGITAIFAQLF